MKKLIILGTCLLLSGCIVIETNPVDDTFKEAEKTETDATEAINATLPPVMESAYELVKTIDGIDTDRGIYTCGNVFFASKGGRALVLDNAGIEIGTFDSALIFEEYKSAVCTKGDGSGMLDLDCVTKEIKPSPGGLGGMDPRCCYYDVVNKRVMANFFETEDGDNMPNEELEFKVATLNDSMNYVIQTKEYGNFEDKNTEYYIWNPRAKSVHGPYTSNEAYWGIGHNCFHVDEHNRYYFYHVEGENGYYFKFNGIYPVKNGETWTITDGNKTSEKEYDSVVSCAENTLIGKRGGREYLITGVDKEELLPDKTTQVSQAIDGIRLMCVDNQWGLYTKKASD